MSRRVREAIFFCWYVLVCLVVVSLIVACGDIGGPREDVDPCMRVGEVLWVIYAHDSTTVGNGELTFWFTEHRVCARTEEEARAGI